MAEYYPLFKTLHIVGFVAWFAGMFYLVRMFVYHVEAMDEDEPKRSILTEQFNLMENRVYSIICNPAMMITWLFGLLMIVNNGWAWLTINYWLQFKLFLLILLSGYQGYMKVLIRKLAKGERPYTSYQFRLLNEVPTVFLLSISLLAVYKNGLNAVSALVGIIVFGFLLVMGTKLYKRIRERAKS